MGDTKYKDFTEYPEKLLTEGQSTDMVKVNGIARRCDEVLIPEKKGKHFMGFLELCKDKFIRLYGKV